MVLQVEHAGNDEAPASSPLRFSHCLVFERPVGTYTESRVAAVGRRAADVSFFSRSDSTSEVEARLVWCSATKAGKVTTPLSCVRAA